MMFECRNWSSSLKREFFMYRKLKNEIENYLELTQIPNKKFSIITSREDERFFSIPMDHINVIFMRIGSSQHTGSVRIDSSVPYPMAMKTYIDFNDNTIKKLYISNIYLQSTEQEARTLGSLGDHWRSSTELV